MLVVFLPAMVLHFDILQGLEQYQFSYEIFLLVVFSLYCAFTSLVVFFFLEVFSDNSSKETSQQENLTWYNVPV